MTNALIDSWRQYLASPVAGMHSVGDTHPLHFFVGKTEADRPRVVIRSDERPPILNLSDAVLIDRFQDQSGRWNLSFTVQDGKFDEVFLRLADDLHARSAAAANQTIALDRVRNGLEQWRRLLQVRPSGLLSMEELRGLIGELWLVLEWFGRDRPVDAAVAGWLGPLGLPQDFWYPDDGYYEAKTIGPSTSRVKITSEFQLDADDLNLLVLVVGSVAESSPGAVNLPVLYSRVETRLNDVGASADPLAERFQRLGVNLEASFYRDSWFSFLQVSSYAVDSEFPCIRASTLGTGISRVKYQIDLADIRAFQRTTTEVSVSSWS